MEPRELELMEAFFAQTDEHGVCNLEKAKSAKVIRRVATTDKEKSFEAVESVEGQRLPGMVEVDGKLVGLGIHIYNEDVYPLQSFEIYLRGCDLTGHLDLSGCDDMVFLDLYNNRITSVTPGSMASMMILGLQNNQISRLDTTGLPKCVGIDVGKNQLKALDVSANPQLVELYVNDNQLTEIDLSQNKKLKYFYCHNNRISRLDTTDNILLRHLNATGNPMTEIRSYAPQREELLPLVLHAGVGGYVGLKYNPVYTPQWKETGLWEQCYEARPREGWEFEGWYDDSDVLVSEDALWIDDYGNSRILTAKFKREE